MDLDPSVEPELDSFSLTLPLPYRVALIIVLGAYFWQRKVTDVLIFLAAVWAWGANLHYLTLLKIVGSI